MYKISRIDLTITTENAAFGDTEDEQYAQIARILRGYAAKLEDGSWMPEQTLRDSNGNTIGQVSVTRASGTGELN